MHLRALPPIFRNAKDLRLNMTPAEKILWEYLKDRKMEEVKFRRQHPLRHFIPDFYAHELKLIIEIDGEYHEKRNQQFSDEQRELKLKASRCWILRFKNQDVYDTLDDVVEKIRNYVIALKSQKHMIKR